MTMLPTYKRSSRVRLALDEADALDCGATRSSHLPPLSCTERVKVAKEEYLKNPIAKSAGDLVPDDVVQTLQGFENEIPPLVEA